MSQITRTNPVQQFYAMCDALTPELQKAQAKNWAGRLSERELHRLVLCSVALENAYTAATTSLGAHNINAIVDLSDEYGRISQRYFPPRSVILASLCQSLYRGDNQHLQILRLLPKNYQSFISARFSNAPNSKQFFTRTLHGGSIERTVIGQLLAQDQRTLLEDILTGLRNALTNNTPSNVLVGQLFPTFLLLDPKIQNWAYTLLAEVAGVEGDPEELIARGQEQFVANPLNLSASLDDESIIEELIYLADQMELTTLEEGFKIDDNNNNNQSPSSSSSSSSKSYSSSQSSRNQNTSDQSQSANDLATSLGRLAVNKSQQQSQNPFSGHQSSTNSSSSSSSSKSHPSSYSSKNMSSSSSSSPSKSHPSSYSHSSKNMSSSSSSSPSKSHPSSYSHSSKNMSSSSSSKPHPSSHNILDTSHVGYYNFLEGGPHERQEPPRPVELKGQSSARRDQSPPRQPPSLPLQRNPSRIPTREEFHKLRFDTTHFLLHFYGGNEVNIRQGAWNERTRRGFTINQFLNWNHEELQSRGDWAAVLFPNLEGSETNPNSIILNKTILLAFLDNAELRDRLLNCALHYLDSLGLRYNNRTQTIEPTVRGYRNWLSRDNHNFRILTHLLFSLNSLGHPRIAQALFNRLTLIYNNDQKLDPRKQSITPEDFGFWQAAMKPNNVIVRRFSW